MTAAAVRSTLADLLHEPDDSRIRELHDGEIRVLPEPDEDQIWHVRLLDLMLGVSAPEGVEIHHSTGVHVDEANFFVPDLLVVRAGTPFHDNGFDATGVVLVVEVLGPLTHHADRILKPWRYAEAGIPYFWRIDQGPRLVALRLDETLGDGHYIYDTELVPCENAEVPHPWVAQIDMAEFVDPPSRR